MTHTYYAPAKINLWLRVFSADASGYHPLDTLFCAVDLRDRLEVHDADGLYVDVIGADVGPVEQNLVYRAARDYFEEIGSPPAVRLVLHKQIPAGAGLGGGSSDAATTLLALQDRNEHRVPQNKLMDIAANLGSDVPFFLCGSALARALGRGVVLEALEPLPERHVVIALPAFRIATRDAYRWLDESGLLGAPEDALPAPLDWNDVARKSTNTFELVLFARYPALRWVVNFLQDNGAATAHISGSGSAVFGIFPDAGSATAACQVLALDPTLRIFEARTLGA